MTHAMTQRPIVWSISGTDSGGGAGLSADQRAADAMQVHLCPVVAAVTAQNSQAVTHIQPVGAAHLSQQLQTLAQDMPPLAIKTGLLGNAEQIACVAHWVDRLRALGPLSLVVDPVLRSSTGAAFADDETLQAYRDLLIPRATLITPNRQEAGHLLGDLPGSDHDPQHGIPEQAQRLACLGSQAVCITGGDSQESATQEPAWALDWMHTPQAQGWLALPRQHTPHTHGTGCTFATAAAAALARGFVSADALVLAKMATLHALRNAQWAGHGAGYVHAQADFIFDRSLLPRLSWSPTCPIPFAPAPTRPLVHPPITPPSDDIGLYAVVETVQQLQAVIDAGVCTVQLRIKAPALACEAWVAKLQQDIKRSVQVAHDAPVDLYINDHAQWALQAGAQGVHLGQEDLLALTDSQRLQLARTANVGISSHSLWELCRAASFNPRYIACGPVWPTSTKAMPWRAQGVDNLAWWCAMAPCPVVAIGGILSATEVQQAAQAGAHGIAVVRGIGPQPSQTVPLLLQAIHTGRNLPAVPLAWPHPSLGANLSENPVNTPLESS